MNARASRRANVLTALLVGTLLATALGTAHAVGTTAPKPPKTVFVARGDNPADALVVGPIAGRVGALLVTTPPTFLSPQAKATLEDVKPELIVIAGSTAAVSADVEAEIRQVTGLNADKIWRASGEDRYDTARLLAELSKRLPSAFVAVDGTASHALDAEMLGGKSADTFMQMPFSMRLVGAASIGRSGRIWWASPNLTVSPDFERPGRIHFTFRDGYKPHRGRTLPVLIMTEDGFGSGHHGFVGMHDPDAIPHSETFTVYTDVNGREGWAPFTLFLYDTGSA